MFARALLAIVFTSYCAAQNTSSASVARQVAGDVDGLSRHVTLAEWERVHANETLNLPRYNPAAISYGVEFTSEHRWCMSSARNSSSALKRWAEFYVPAVEAGALPRLPENVSASLRSACELQALFYQFPAALSAEAVAHELSSRWGDSNGTSFQPDLVGSAYWRSVSAWHRSGVSVWVAVDPGGPIPTGESHLIVYARADMAQDDDVMNEWVPTQTGAWRRVAAAATQIAALDNGLTRQMLSRANCGGRGAPAEEAAISSARLARWLRASQDLPRQRRAAALLLADAYVTCTQYASGAQESYKKLGAQFEGGCPQDGPAYSHNFRTQAEEVGAAGPAGELAELTALSDPCNLKGQGEWPDLLLRKGGALVARFPGNQWTPYLHYLLAGGHDARLAFAYPDGAGESGRTPLSRAAMQHERRAAIFEFKEFLAAKPMAAEAVSAWQEAWRLAANLPPSPVAFGCGCE